MKQKDVNESSAFVGNSFEHRRCNLAEVDSVIAPGTSGVRTFKQLYHTVKVGARNTIIQYYMCSKSAGLLVSFHHRKW